MTDTTSDELLTAVREAVRGVTAKWDRKYYLDKTATGDAPTEMYRAMADQGLFALGVPDEMGGNGGGIAATATVMEEMSRAGCPPMLFSLTCFSRQAILRHGTPRQIEQHVVPSMSGDRMFCFAFTEAESGTNSFKMRTSAVRNDDGSYRLNGQKVFISGADQADHALVAARTTPYEHAARKSDGISLFVINMSTAGIHVEPMNIDWRAPERQFTVYFDDVVVPADSLLGDEGNGAAVMFDSLNAERVVISAWTLGLGYLAVAKAVEYARTRAPWGRPTGSYQSVAHPLARARAHLDAAKALTYHAAERIDAGHRAGDEANIAKLLASEAADAAIDAAIQTFGGSAFDLETDIVTLWPMIRILRIAPLNNEMILNYIAEHVLGLPRNY